MPQSFRKKSFQKFGFFLFSLFIIWHAFAIVVVSPYSKSYLSKQIRTPFNDYIYAIKQGGPWSFYAPAFKGSMVRYETINSNGQTKEYPLSHMRSKLSNAYFRYTNFNVYLFYNRTYTKNRKYDKSVAHYLCLQHINEKIKALNFILIHQKTFTYQDFTKGKRPLDSEFTKRTVIGPYNCDKG